MKPSDQLSDWELTGLWRHHPMLPWIVTVACLITLAITAWFVIPVLKNSPRSAGSLPPLPTPVQERASDQDQTYPR